MPKEHCAVKYVMTDDLNAGIIRQLAPVCMNERLPTARLRIDRR